MNVENLGDRYLAELQEARSVEAQLSEALPKMGDAANAKDLKRALADHLGETRSQLDRIDDILRRHGVDTRAHSDQSMQRIIAETDKWAGMVDDQACRDAGLIASAQRIEHYEIAVYGTLASWAVQLGLEKDAATLRAILAEDKSADDALTRLAKGEVNPDAAA
ncbi:ferritin-like domain-containing protein [Rhodovulum sp. 12E13]|uniref:YciE/YciF ferroxidase family protein n=1 Tax=Rhodovulum sp. 12E13 TaxID=2203891 RepID=UPI000E18EA84|nr:DUF892 family protein [Rhodovulum sp. 12E13]RDC72337.1 ferritin-like domain-containing protein [Rhodovulum sp. 12E13]